MSDRVYGLKLKNIQSLKDKSLSDEPMANDNNDPKRSDREEELYKDVAVLKERVEGISEKIATENSHLSEKLDMAFKTLTDKVQLNNESNDKIVQKMDEWVQINISTEKRLEKVEEHIQKRIDRAKTIKKALWGLLIAGLGIGVERIAGLIFGKLF